MGLEGCLYSKNSPQKTARNDEDADRFASDISFSLFGSTVFNGTTLFKHKGHDGHKGKTYESKAIFSLCVLGALRGETLSR